MKKLIFLILLFCASGTFAQFKFFDVGNTRIKDSTGWSTMNRNLLVNGNVFARGYLQLDTSGYGKIFYTGNTLTIQQNKRYGGMYFENTDRNSGVTFLLGSYVSTFQISKTTYDARTESVAQIDSTGINIPSGSTYKINGVAISGSGSSNLFGYHHKDTSFTANQHFRAKTFTIWGQATDDSARFTVDAGRDLIVTPTGSNITFGSTSLTGTKNVYAGAYYVGDSLLTAKTLTFTRRITVNDTLKTKFISALNNDTVVVKHGLRVNGRVTLDASNMDFGGVANALYMSSGDMWFNGLKARLNSLGLLVGDGSTGQPFLNVTGSTGNVQYGFYNDMNTGLLRNGADDISLVTNATDRLQITNSAITLKHPTILTGNYFKISPISESTRDGLTPAEGMIIMNADTHKLQIYDGSTWQDAY